MGLRRACSTSSHWYRNGRRSAGTCSEVNGNDLDALVPAFDTARELNDPRPRVIICDTKMAKGVPFLERREKTHFLRVEPHEWQLALKALDERRPA